MKSSDYKNLKAQTLESASNLEMEEQEEFINDLAAERRSEERQNKVIDKNTTQKRKISKEILINIRLSPEDKKEWADFSREIDFSLSMTIRKAMKYYIQQYRRGKLDI